MKRSLLALVVALTCLPSVQARGLVIPVDKSIAPLAMLNHRVNVTIEDQVALTKLEQTFRNHTSRDLEATYVFPVPRGASVREFAMWVDGKRVTGELLDAAQARQIYTDIVRRTQDPGLLEYIGQDVLQMRVYPVPAKGDQKIEVSYTSLARKDHELIEYTYPLKTDGKATSTLEDFTLKLTLKSQQPLLNIYSPSHAISVNRAGDKEAIIGFEKSQSMLDRDFQLFWTTGGKDVGLTALMHRPITTEDGTVLLLISPRAELAKSQQVPRDLVFVLDTSGSMRDEAKINQAKKALKHCLDRLTSIDRFAVMNFATTINKYTDGLTPVSKEQIDTAKKWVDNLEATGGTAINDALLAALELQKKDEGRTFTIVFFTDGQPTVGETNADRIMANVSAKNTAQTRIFTFGVGNDLNAVLLDQIAETTRAASTFVRPEEDMEAKVSSFFGKISHPVLVNLKLTAGSGVGLKECYPPQLPDLFHGGQVIVLAKYNGANRATITLTGNIGIEKKEYTYEVDFPAKAEEKAFVADLWARRKVGYLLDQIRLNGAKKELVDEVTALAKKFRIATPFTSYLVVPDSAMPVARGPQGGRTPPVPPGFPSRPADFARNRITGGTGIGGLGGQGGGGFPGGGGIGGGGLGGGLGGGFPGGGGLGGGGFGGSGLGGGLGGGGFAGGPGGAGPGAGGPGGFGPSRTDPAKRPDDEKAQREAEERRRVLMHAEEAFRRGDLRGPQTDKAGVDFAIELGQLKGESRQQRTATKNVNGRQLTEVGGVWIDEGFDPKLPTLIIKAQSDAYFKLLERQPHMKDVLALGNRLVWVTPNGTALIIDTHEGKEKLADIEIDKLFVRKR